MEIALTEDEVETKLNNINLDMSKTRKPQLQKLF